MNVTNSKASLNFYIQFTYISTYQIDLFNPVKILLNLFNINVKVRYFIFIFKGYFNMNFFGGVGRKGVEKQALFYWFLSCSKPSCRPPHLPLRQILNKPCFLI